MNRLTALVVATLTPATAFAHAGVYAGGFTHPFSGLDHMLVMVSVGIMAVMWGGRASWVLPAIFVAGMVGGGLLAFAGTDLPVVALGIALSAVVTGCLIMCARQLSLAMVGIAIAGFGIFHGHAHVAEMPGGSSIAGYVFGFVAATSILHGIGLIAGTALLKASASYGNPVLRVVGGAVTALGLGILVGAV